MPDANIDPLPRSSDLADAELVLQTLAGDARCFAVLMRRYNQRVFRIARGILRSDAEAEDASQDAFVRAYERLDQLTAPEAFGPWVGRISANMALLRLRRHKRFLEIVEREESTVMSDESAGTAPDHLAYSQEVRILIESALDELPVLYRSVLVLRDIEEMTTEEAAEALSVPPGTVRVRLHRARRLMREHLGREVDVQAAGLFSFDGERCDRLVASVFRQLRERRAAWDRPAEARRGK